MATELSLYQRLVRASRKGKGLRLSADDVWALASEGWVEERASMDDEADAERRSKRGAAPEPKE